MSKKLLSLGLMSGTSLDGLDLALCRFKKKGKGYNYEILKASTLPYSKDWKKKLATAQHLSAEDLFELNAAYGKFLGSEVNKFLKGIKKKPDIISSHGHTIFHRPEKGFTVQIGNGADVAAATGITTVCDFRSLDVALGGQGAPLVP
ncbi:MAG: anhydro-N-acetylmuramic acid kinase, partial [Bacteroidia bacterium]|nr:anhydro-N-acetylmuramic acid kinase [Bacteroidia bacterium]